MPPYHQRRLSKEQKMKNEQDYWQAEDFEDTVARALIACYESKIKKQKGAAPSDRLSDEVLFRMRQLGPYIPSDSRIVGIDLSSVRQTFDMLNDRLPDFGCIAHKNFMSKRPDDYDGYIFIHLIQKRETLGKYWFRRAGGELYESFVIFPTADKVHGERDYFTVTREGVVVSCDQSIPENLRGDPGHRTATIIKSAHEPDSLKETEVWGSVGLQLLADRRFCWSITAQEHMAKAHLGCMQEEVKSLLYARSLPMTSTGRKRPILHLVEAHKRRLRSGTEVDVTAFLRGQQVVEIGGTVFKVNPPRVCRPKVSLNSQARYFDAEAA